MACAPKDQIRGQPKLGWLNSQVGPSRVSCHITAGFLLLEALSWEALEAPISFLPVQHIYDKLFCTIDVKEDQETVKLNWRATSWFVIGS